mmetsp:Transcript_4829/g.14886  ORF Transcript_4829/g.14886 Transcript_4829/m.14886 type:complete len:473 (+) Transcript_4829:63-1481(+)
MARLAAVVLVFFTHVLELHARRANPPLALLQDGASEMPHLIRERMKLHMKPGQEASVGFEFECANKNYRLKKLLPPDMVNCPAVEFPLDGTSASEPLELPAIFGPRYGKLNMSNFPDMAQAVRNVVWTKDAYSGDHGPNCTMLGQGIQLFNKVVYNNGNCSCKYTLEFKTLPMGSREELREAMVGAGLTLGEASKYERAFAGWNAEELFRMNPETHKCIGATHVTKAFVINPESLQDMLKQQMVGYCVKGWSKEASGDKVYRTSFVESFMLWRAMSFCMGDDNCLWKAKLTDLCSSFWSTAEDAQSDIEATLFNSSEQLENVMGVARDVLARQYKIPAESLRFSTMECSPGRALAMACEAGAAEVTPGVDWIILNNAEAGFGWREPGHYFGPGGGKRGDTTTKVGAMLSFDGRTLYGLAEHRKDLWNTRDFKKCLYLQLMKAKDSDHGLEMFEKSKWCSKALDGAMKVDYQS